MQASIEELETTNEELQSVNEELLASNEELQSTNEELHSVNEELYTVNSEHQQKIGELVDVTEDLEHLLQATQVGTLFLDKTMAIRRFTPSATMALPLRSQDIGRSLEDLHTHLVGADLASLVRGVMDSGESEERRFTTQSGVPLLVGVLPYRRGSTGGAVLTFVDLRRLEEEGKHAGERASILHAIDETSQEVLWVTDAESLRPLFVSKAYERTWGQPLERCLDGSVKWTQSIHADDRDRVEREFFEKARSGLFDCEYRIVRPDGEIRWVRDRRYASTQEEVGSVIFGIAEDISERIEAERQRRRDSELFRDACSNTPVPMLLTDSEGEVRWHNDAVTALFPGGPAPKSFTKMIAGEDDQATWRRQARAIVEGSQNRASVELDLALGSDDPCRFQIDSAPTSGPDRSLLVCQLIDLSHHVSRTAELAAQAEEFESEALTDALTGLLNRRGADRRLERMITRDRRHSEQTMAILIDCDNFKTINDASGYDAGDAVLKEIGRRLRRSLRPNDLAARVGGDEFLVVASAARLAEAAHVGDKLRRIIAEEPVTCEGKAVSATVSVGVVPVSRDVQTVEQILAAAGQVLRRSKMLGRNRVSFADEDGGLQSTARALDELLESEDLRVVQQSLNDTESGAIVGYELLSRGPEPWVQPAALFDLFQRHDRLEDIDIRCLAACVAVVNAETKTKAPAGQRAAERRHINVLPSSLLQERWPQVREILLEVRDPQRVTLELSEQQFVGPSNELRDRLAEIRELGFKLALDDVGFGHSALETLLAVEPEVVKIDRTMVTAIHRDAGSRRVLERMVKLLESMQCELIAEGVENDAQRRVLCELGVPMAQGFLWSHPDRRN